MTHFVSACDVIGHDVTILSDIKIERTRPKLDVGQVSWSLLSQLKIYRHFFHPNNAPKNLKFQKNPKIRGGELRMVPLRLFTHINDDSEIRIFKENLLINPRPQKILNRSMNMLIEFFSNFQMHLIMYSL